MEQDQPRKDAVVQAATATVEVRAMPVTVRLRSHFSTHHLRAAVLFARRANELESSYGGGEFDDDLFIPHRAYVTGAILSAAAFLEANINELFSDAADPVDLPVQKALPPKVVERLALMWELGEVKTTRYSTLDKYQLALALADKPRFDRGKAPYQDAAFLVNLRNALIHFKPEWSTVGEDSDDATVAKRMAGQLGGKFPENALFVGKGNAFFPDKCLGYGCAAWAIRSAVALSDAFAERIGMKPPYESVRAEIALK